jgi:transposase
VSKSIERVVGFDVGDRRIEVCVVSLDAGRVLAREKVATRREALEPWLAAAPRSRIVLETGTHAPWIARAAEAAGHEVIVADARTVELITKSRKKTDRRDAELLARLGRSDQELLRPVHVRSQTTQRQRALLRMRDALVRARAQQINCVRGVMKTDGRPLQSCGAEAFAGRVRETADTSWRGALEPVLAAIDALTGQIRSYDAMLTAIAERDYAPALERVSQPAGVGTLTALALILAVEDPRRFRNGREMSAYLGLVPRRRQSGDSDPDLGISKEGDAYARRLLVSAAHYVLERGPDTDLKRWGLALEARWGPKTRKRAAVAVARKLAVLLWRLWTDGQRYEPLRHAAAAA